MPPQSDKNTIPSFREFFESMATSGAETYLSHPTARVTDEVAFNAMKLHISRLYEGVEVMHTFMDESGQIFDCVPIAQQPSIRRAGSKKIAEPPDLPTNERARGAGEVHVQPQLRPDRKDRYGNSIWAPPGTIAMRRVTLEELTRFKSVEHFQRKTPLGKGRHPRLSMPQADSAVHKYAHAYQVVDNLGGHNFLNVWAPPIGPNQVFSLSQHWYTGGSGAQLQTAEVGWQVFPQKYSTAQPVLFIYWTADDYQSTGCYNLDGVGFVQTDPQWAFGATFSPPSTSGGTQYEIEAGWYLSAGNWWLYLKGGAVGYYPTSLYSGGQMASHATDVDYGGEAVGDGTWPPMGSGAFASAGWQKAAYQRDIFFFPTGGGTQYADLTPLQPSPACYTIGVASTSPPWNEYFYFGGPGGTNC